MTDERLAEIRARCDAATPGPWSAQHLARGVRHLDRNCSDWYFDELPDGYNLPGRHGGYGGTHDGSFIAHARTDIPDLLDEIRRLRAALDEARKPDLRTVLAYEAGQRDGADEIKRLRGALADIELAAGLSGQADIVRRCREVLPELEGTR